MKLLSFEQLAYTLKFKFASTQFLVFINVSTRGIEVILFYFLTVQIKPEYWEGISYRISRLLKLSKIPGGKLETLFELRELKDKRRTN